MASDEALRSDDALRHPKRIPPWLEWPEDWTGPKGAEDDEPITVYVRITPDGGRITLPDVRPDLTVEEAKKLLSARSGIPASKLGRLRFKGKLVRDPWATLRELGIRHGKELTALVPTSSTRAPPVPFAHTAISRITVNGVDLGDVGHGTAAPLWQRTTRETSVPAWPGGCIVVRVELAPTGDGGQRVSMEDPKLKGWLRVVPSSYRGDQGTSSIFGSEAALGPPTDVIEAETRNLLIKYRGVPSPNSCAAGDRSYILTTTTASSPAYNNMNNGGTKGRRGQLSAAPPGHCKSGIWPFRVVARPDAATLCARLAGATAFYSTEQMLQVVGDLLRRAAAGPEEREGARDEPGWALTRDMVLAAVVPPQCRARRSPDVWTDEVDVVYRKILAALPAVASWNRR